MADAIILYTSSLFSNALTKNYDEINTKLISKIDNLLSTNEGSITINISANVSPQPGLAQKRVDTIINYFKGTSLKKYLEGSPQRLIIKQDSSGQNSQIKYWDNSRFTNGLQFNCSNEKSDSSSPADTEVYNLPSMACRRVVITKIEPNLSPAKAPKNDNGTVVGNNTDPNSIKSQQTNVTPQNNDIFTKRPEISKRILRLLLSECDYFEVVKENVPFLYDSFNFKKVYNNINVSLIFKLLIPELSPINDSLSHVCIKDLS